MCQEMARLHIFAPFNPELLGALSSKNFSKKNLLFEAEIYVPGYAQNAGFCSIYPRASGDLQRPPGCKDHLASEVGLIGQPNNFFAQPKF
jgi:hypothetical protein